MFYKKNDTFKGFYFERASTFCLVAAFCYNSQPDRHGFGEVNK